MYDEKSNIEIHTRGIVNSLKVKIKDRLSPKIKNIHRNLYFIVTKYL